MENEVVWLSEERTPALLVQRFAHYAVVRYYRGGLDFEVEVPNDEIEYGEDHAIEYESE